MSAGTIIAVCTSKKKGTPKADVGSGTLEVGYGLKDDAHGGRLAPASFPSCH